MTLAPRLMHAFAVLCALLVTGCGSPAFHHPPPANFASPLPDGVAGLWARAGKDNGERARISAPRNGQVRIHVYKVGEEDSDEALHLSARTYRFDDTDWIVVEPDRLTENQAGAETGDRQVTYVLLKYIRHGEDKLCGAMLDPEAFALAIQSGALDGRVDPPTIPAKTTVTVSSSGEDWMDWWMSLPASAKKFRGEELYCFQRA